MNATKQFFLQMLYLSTPPNLYFLSSNTQLGRNVYYLHLIKFICDSNLTFVLCQYSYQAYHLSSDDLQLINSTDLFAYYV